MLISNFKSSKNFHWFSPSSRVQKYHLLSKIIGISHLTTRKTVAGLLWDDVKFILDGLSETIIT